MKQNRKIFPIKAIDIVLCLYECLNDVLVCTPIHTNQHNEIMTLHMILSVRFQYHKNV